MSEEVTITETNFEAEVLKSPVPVLLDFWAEWCAPCKMIAPAVADLAKAYTGKLKVGKVDVDSEGELAMKYSIVSIPTLLVFKNGEVVNQKVGAVSRQAIEGLVKEFIA
jgi:thioredoxin